MTKLTTNSNELNMYVENRDKILLDLQQIYTTDFYHSSHHLGITKVNNEFLRPNIYFVDKFQSKNFIDNSTCNTTKTMSLCDSPIVDDLLKTVNSAKLRKYSEFNDTSCYRCKHFLTVPQNLLQTPFERISESAEEYVVDLSFVQAIVWLKSAITCMKDVSVEEFHLTFHKLWDNNRSENNATKTKTKEDPQDNGMEFCEEGLLQLSDANNAGTLNSDSESDDSINLLLNYDKRNSTRKRITKRSITSRASSPLTPEGYWKNYAKNVSRHVIIAESDEEYSPSPDMFESFTKSLPSSSSLQYEEENERSARKSIQDFSLTPREDFIDFLLNDKSNIVHFENILQTQNSIIVESSDKCSLTPDISLFLKEASRYKNEMNTEGHEHLSCSSLENYEKYIPLSNSSSCITDIVEITSTSRNFINNSENQKINNKNQCQQDDSAYETNSFDFLCEDTNATRLHRDCNDYNQSLSLIKIYRRERYTENVGGVEMKDISENAAAQRERVYVNGREEKAHALERERSFRGKRKLEYDTNCSPREYVKNDEKRISSQWLNFTLDALNADDIAFQSVKIIISFLQSEDITRQYMRRRCWVNTLENEAVNAVLNFCEIYEAEKNSNVCTVEIAGAIKRSLEEMIGDIELNKTTLWTHRVAIILELCNSIKVCIATIDYLTTKLKSYGSIISSVMNEKQIIVHIIVNQLHLIFYALNICLQKYRLVLPNKKEHQLEEPIMPIVNLWKKQFNPENTTNKESSKIREDRWQTILDDFAVIASEDFVQFTEKSRRLFHVLASV